MLRKLSLAAFAFAFAAPAYAWVYVGNPAVTLRADRPAGDLVSGTVALDFVRVHKCGGGYDDYVVNETIDPVEGWDIVVSAADICGVSFDWGTPMDLDGTGWSIAYAEAVTSVTISGPTTVSTGLTPFEVTSGTFSGDPVRLYVTVQ